MNTPKRSFLKKNWQSILGYAISFFFLFIVLRKITWTQALDAAKEVTPSLFLLSVLVIAVEFIFQALRWNSVLKGQFTFNLFQTLPSVALGHFFNMIFPSRLGEILRPLHFSRKHKLPFSTLLGSCIIERIFDGLFVVLLLIGMVIYLQIDNYNVKIGGPVGIGVYGFALVFVWLSLKTSILDKLTAFIPIQKVRSLVQSKIEELKEGFGLVKSIPQFLEIALWTAIPLGLNVLANYLLLNAFPLPESLSNIYTAVFLTAIMGIAYTIPAAPSGIGVLNYAVVFGLEVIANKEGLVIDPQLSGRIVMVSLVIYLATLIPDIVLGLFFFTKDRAIVRETTLKAKEQI